MVSVPAFLSWALAVAPVPPSESYDVADVDIERTDNTTQLTAYDAEGEVVGEVVVWADSTGQPMLAVTFPDGLYMFVSTDGENATIDTENAAEVTSRIERLDVAIKQVQASWTTCGVGVGLTALACAGAAALPHPTTVYACGGSLYVTFCDCANTVKQDFECY
jgi:hypothetical protein